MLRLSSHLNRISAWEEHVCVSCNRAAGVPALYHLFALVSRLGNGTFWYVFAIALLAWGGLDALPAVTHMVVVGLAGVLFYRWIKTKTLRPRPYMLHPHIRCSVPPLDQFSFPSGHTMHAVSFTMMAVAYYPALAWGLVPFTLLVACSRLVLGLHYPTDVAAGALIGALFASASFLL